MTSGARVIKRTIKQEKSLSRRSESFEILGFLRGCLMTFFLGGDREASFFLEWRSGSTLPLWWSVPISVWAGGTKDLASSSAILSLGTDFRTW